MVTSKNVFQPPRPRAAYNEGEHAIPGAWRLVYFQKVFGLDRPNGLAYRRMLVGIEILGEWSGFEGDFGVALGVGLVFGSFFLVDELVYLGGGVIWRGRGVRCGHGGRREKFLVDKRGWASREALCE